MNLGDMMLVDIPLGWKVIALLFGMLLPVLTKGVIDKMQSRRIKLE